jgi:hypothetical protein
MRVAGVLLVTALVFSTLPSSVTATRLVPETVPVVWPQAFAGPSTLTIDGTLTDWGTTGDGTNGIWRVQDANNSGESDGSGFAGKLEDINYVWSAIQTASGGSTPPSPSNKIQYYYYRFDTLKNTTFNGNKFWIQVNLNTASAGYADHILQAYVDDGATPKVTLKLYQYSTPYPALRAFTTGTLTGKVANVSGYGTLDTNATGAIGTSGGYYCFEFKIPASWFSSTYGGAIADDGSTTAPVLGAMFTSTGTADAVGTVKDTVNNSSGYTIYSQQGTTDGNSTFPTSQITKVAIITTAQTLTAGTASAVMTAQTQDTVSAPKNVSAATTVSLSSSSGGGTFSTTSGGTYTATLNITIASGANSANFYYKDTVAGTPTITAASTGLTSGTQQETVNPAALNSFVFNTIGTQTAGTAFSITITAKDAYNNTVTSYTGTNTLSASTGSISPTSTTAFTSGVWTGNVTLSTASASMTISTTGSSVNGTSNTFTVNSAAGDITNTPGTYDFGMVNEGATVSTTLSYFTVTNNSSFAINITIGGSDLTGGTSWTLSDTATAGTDQFGVYAGLSGTSFNIIVKKNPAYNTLKSNLAASGAQAWGLQLVAPTTMSDNTAKSGSITLTATMA